MRGWMVIVGAAAFVGVVTAAFHIPLGIALPGAVPIGVAAGLGAVVVETNRGVHR